MSSHAATRSPGREDPREHTNWSGYRPSIPQEQPTPPSQSPRAQERRPPPGPPGLQERPTSSPHTSRLHERRPPPGPPGHQERPTSPPQTPRSERRPSPNDSHAHNRNDDRRLVEVTFPPAVETTTTTTTTPAPATRPRPELMEIIRPTETTISRPKVDFDEVMAIDAQAEDDYEEPADDLSDSDMYIGSVEVDDEPPSTPPPPPTNPPAPPTRPLSTIRPIVLPPAGHPQPSLHEKDSTRASRVTVDPRYPQERPSSERRPHVPLVQPRKDFSE
ncbi:hypothetical protein COOONC_25653 [Cooperia oncophora]